MIRPNGALPAAIVEELNGICLEQGETAWRFGVEGMMPRAVVVPRDVEQLCRVITVARKHRLGVVPVGSATHLEIGWAPLSYELALSTRLMNQVVEHDAEDLTVRVQAGTHLEALNERLAEHGQWVPVDPPGGHETTVGGMIAADRCGPSRIAHGKVRELLLGISVVTGEGMLLKGGGRVVKNVAGYDLPKLFVGSYGSLGVIVEATFKTRPRPTGEALVYWPQPSVGEAVKTALRLRDAPLSPSLLEAVNETAAESLGLEGSSALLAGVYGSGAELEEQQLWLSQLSHGQATRYDDERAPAVIKALRDFSLAANEEVLVAHFSVVPSDLPALLEQLEAEAGARNAVVEIAAHAAIGVAWCEAFMRDTPDTLANFAEWMRECTRRLGGWVVFETRPVNLREQDPWGYHEPAVELMRGVKKVLDPDRVLSPGRFVGGI